MLKWTAALGAAILLCAQTSRIAEADAERAFLDVTVNAVERGQVVAILSGDGDVSLSGADLQRLGVPSLPLRGSIGNNDVSLRALAPMVTFTVDPVALRLRIVIDPKALPRQAIAIGAGSLPSDVVADHPKSSFVNYDVSVSTLTKPTSFIEAGYSHGNTLLYSSATVDPGGISSRGVTYATFDDPRHQTRTQIGTPTSPVVCCSTISRCSASANAVISNLTRFRTAFRPHGWNDRDAGHGERVRQWRLDSKRATAARKFQSVADPRYGRQQRRCGRRPGRRWKDANVRTIVFRGQFASGERYDRLRLQRRARAAIGVRGGLWDAGAGGNLSSWRKRRRDVRWNARSDRNGAGGQIGK